MANLYGDLMGDSPKKVTKPVVTPKDTKIPSVVSSKIPTVVESYPDSVRKSIRGAGNISATMRITAPEEEGIKRLVRHFEDKGYYTDKTQLLRISLNYMLWDFDNNKEQSLLDEILERINTY